MSGDSEDLDHKNDLSENDLIHKYMNMEVDFESSDWEEQLFITMIVELTQTGGKTNLANRLYQLLNITSIYLENVAIRENTKYAHVMHDLYKVISNDLGEEVLGNMLESHSKNMAIGGFIEALCLYGMPRDPAIEATARWLERGKSTVRTDNEKFRSERPNLTKKGLVNYLQSSPSSLIIKQYMEENQEFPMDHVKAKKAFNKSKDLYMNINRPEALKKSYSLL